MERFFEQLLPHLVLESLHEFVLLEGTLHFSIGREKWTFVFGAEDPIRRGHAGEAGLTLRFTPAAFDAFVEGTLDPVAAVRGGDIKGSGDYALLEQFARILRPPSQALWG